MNIKILWLIDGSYLYKGMRNFRESHSEFSSGGFSYIKLKELVKQTLLQAEGAEDIKRIMSLYFNSTPDPATDSQNKFHTWLKTAEPYGPGISVKLYGLKEKTYNCSQCGNEGRQKIQKGVDVGIATSALMYYEQYDAIAISAGDGDFADFVQYISESKNKDIYIFGFRGSVSADIQQYANKVVYLDDVYKNIYDDRAESSHIVPFESADEVD